MVPEDAMGGGLPESRFTAGASPCFAPPKRFVRTSAMTASMGDPEMAVRGKLDGKD